jgi:DNA replication ATP-dependent helicase Dna2
VTQDATAAAATLRGPVVGVGERRTVDTRNGERDLAEIRLRPERGAGEPVRVTLWGKWAETAAHAEPGMDLLVAHAERDDFRGEEGYATGQGTYVVLEPDFLVDVTALRSWVQCPRLYYLNKLGGIPLAEPVVKGTIVHEVFGDLLRGRDLDAAVADAVDDAGLELGLLDADPEAMTETVREHAGAIEGWLSQGVLTDEDEWRSEQTLVSPTFGVKGRADALRRGMPVELKTGKNLKREPRFQDKVQAACYALLLADRAAEGPPRADETAADTGTLLYTKNAAVERSEESGDLSPAKDFGIGAGFLKFVVRTRNALAAMEHDSSVPTGYEADATCEYCFEQDTCMVVSGRLDQESKAGQIGSPLPEAERAYFADWYRRIEAERRAVHREYRKLWEQTPRERADDDRAIIDLDPAGRERTGDGRWRLRATRRTATASKIRDGDTVLASDGDPVGGTAELARVESLTADEVVVTTDEPLTLRRIDVYPSELSVDRRLTALHDFVLKGDERRRDVLLGRADPAFREDERTLVENNDAQNRALNRALNAEDFALVHGPPGTGKTYTIARLVRELVADGQRVLLAAFTNRAVDNCLEALREQDRGIDALRMGTETGVRADMRSLTLDESLPPAERAAALEGASVVAATTATCGSRPMREQNFDVAIVDEATQLTEPDALAAIDLAERFVLVGDHEQLPPVVREEAMDTSLFERLIEEHPEAGVLLDRQYRMAQRIQAFPSQEFYDGALRPATGAVAGQSPAAIADPDALGVLADPVSFVHVGGDDGAHTDAVEAERVRAIVDRFVDAGVDPDDVGVIAPFRAQVAEIGRRVPDGVTVDTVDRFQGSSEEVVVVSFVATGDLEGPIFEDHRRLNVALTRAKKALVLVGDRAALTSDDTYARMVAWADR